MAPHPLTLEVVLANVRRGQVAYVWLTKEQKKALRDTEGKIALDVLRHLLGARPMVPERFPLTERACQAIARRLGYVIGQKRCRRMVARLLETGVIGRAGQYRQPYRNSAARSGFCVALYKLGRRLGLPALLSASVLSATAHLSSAIHGRVGGSIRCSETFMGFRHLRSPVCAGCG
jgi:hypothetical protein